MRSGGSSAISTDFCLTSLRKRAWDSAMRPTPLKESRRVETPTSGPRPQKRPLSLRPTSSKGGCPTVRFAQLGRGRLATGGRRGGAQLDDLPMWNQYAGLAIELVKRRYLAKERAGGGFPGKLCHQFSSRMARGGRRWRATRGGDVLILLANVDEGLLDVHAPAGRRGPRRRHLRPTFGSEIQGMPTTVQFRSWRISAQDSCQHEKPSKEGGSTGTDRTR